ncbi:MAG: HEAT repeat domain-containing protein [Nostoc sp. ChiSLP02]|nr:HEAT repeat domain-containing protein [Nostoc sp. DedSLP05]MDZ8100681.1 HEAT repeat domain-containing protein [Nostoc sp. DedSLP01]MDZ8188886.1 HEAT repeat domain-containing protein [Nostoc sp. ChiSLP02]
MTKHTRQLLLTVLKVVVLCLTLLLLGTSNSWAQIASDSKIAPLIEKLIDNDAHIRSIAADTLVNIGSPAVPSLIEALKNQDRNLRWHAASVLGDLGAEAAPAVPALSAALQDEDAQVRLYATLALGNIGTAAKPAVPSLMAALQDKEQYVRIYVPSALRKIGVEAKVAIPVLTAALKDNNPTVRYNAAYALGAMGTEAVSAVPNLISLLNDDLSYVRLGAIKGLGGIAAGFQDKANALPTSKLQKVILDFEKVLATIQEYKEKFTETDIRLIRRPLNALKAEKETRLFDRSLEWVFGHKLLLGIAAYVILLPSVWLILLRVAPLWLLKINNALKPYKDFSLPFVSVNVLPSVRG